MCFSEQVWNNMLTSQSRDLQQCCLRLCPESKSFHHLLFSTKFHCLQQPMLHPGDREFYQLIWQIMLLRTWLGHIIPKHNSYMRLLVFLVRINPKCSSLPVWYQSYYTLERYPISKMPNPRLWTGTSSKSSVI